MNKKTVSGIVLALLLISMSTLVFNTQPLWADSPTEEFPTVYVHPSVSVANKPNLFSISIKIFNVTDLWGWKITLRWKGGLLWCENAVEGTFLNKNGTQDTWWIPPVISNFASPPCVILSDLVKAGGIGVNGSGNLANITFSVTDTGNCTLELYEVKLIDSDFLPIPPNTGPPFYYFTNLEHGYFCTSPPVISASVYIDPDTLNLKSKGKWITAYIQLSEGHNPEDIDATTVLLNETIQPVLDPMYDFVTNSSEYLVDHDGDGVLERMVKFNRTEVASWIHDDLGIEYGNVALIITGELFDGTQFEGIDTIKVLFPGDADDDGDIDSNDLYIISRCHGMNSDNPSYCPLADFNEDGYINSEDLLILSENYRKTA